MLWRRALHPGTPLEDTVQHEYGQLQEQYAAVADVLRAALETSYGADASSTDCYDATEQQTAQPNPKLCPGISHAEAMKALAWAQAVVDCCGLAGPSGCQKCVLPLICAMPKVHPRSPDIHSQSLGGGNIIKLIRIGYQPLFCTPELAQIGGGFEVGRHSRGTSTYRVCRTAAHSRAGAVSCTSAAQQRF